MMEAFLVPEKTVVSAKGDGPALDVSGAKGRIFLLTLAITNIIEQESLDVSIHGSADGATWDAEPVVGFSAEVLSRGNPAAAQSDGAAGDQVYPRALGVGRWGRGTETPMFEFHVTLREVPKEILAEAAGRARVAVEVRAHPQTPFCAICHPERSEGSAFAAKCRSPLIFGMTCPE
jgi:hypothetical protein